MVQGLGLWVSRFEVFMVQGLGFEGPFTGSRMTLSALFGLS